MTETVSKPVFMFSDEVIAAARAHARAEFPAESCGLVVNDAYIPCRNVAADPLEDFEVDKNDQARALTQGRLQAVIHSHPFVPKTKEDQPMLCPTKSDMEGQFLTAVPWAIVPLSAEVFFKPVIWGTGEIPPLLGREFVPGVTDCFSLIRDLYRLGREECAKQDIDWPFPPIDFADVARDPAWELNGENMYIDNFAKWGFVEISFSEARAGDVFLIGINHDTLNHAGVLIGNNLLAQHLPKRLSRREPAGLWARGATKWLRYAGAAA